MTHLYVRIHIVIFIPYKIFTIYKFHPSLCVSQNVTAHAQSTSTTHFSCSSKCRRTSLYKSYHRVFDFSNQKARVRAIMLRRHICRLRNIQTHQQRCVHKINSPKNSYQISRNPRRIFDFVVITTYS